jgi:hypothetical protein
MTLRDKLVKIGARIVRHGRYVVYQLAEVALPRASDRSAQTRAAPGMRGAAMRRSRQRRCVYDQRDRPTLGPNAGRKARKAVRRALGAVSDALGLARCTGRAQT